MNNLYTLEGDRRYIRLKSRYRKHPLMLAIKIIKNYRLTPKKLNYLMKAAALSGRDPEDNAPDNLLFTKTRSKSNFKSTMKKGWGNFLSNIGTFIQSGIDAFTGKSAKNDGDLQQMQEIMQEQLLKNQQLESRNKLLMIGGAGILGLMLFMKQRPMPYYGRGR